MASAYAAQTLLGKGGAVALLIVLFMAVTSCASAELIAVSSLLTFDVYQRYIKPAATPKNLIFISHCMICVFGLTMAVFACIWNAIGIDLGWLFLVMGLLIGGAVFPAAFAILWKDQSAVGAIAGALSGLAAGLIAWLVTAKQYFGEISVSSTGEEYSTLAGNLAAIMTGLIVTTIISLIKPQNFDWEITRAINALPAKGRASSVLAGVKDPSIGTDPVLVNDGDREKDKEDEAAASVPTTPPNEALREEEDEEMQLDEQLEDHPSSLRGTYKLALIASFLMTFIMDFLIPMPMFFSHYIFSKGFFTGWVIISFLWVFSSAFISVVLPIAETAGFFKKLAVEIARDLRRKK